jgi:HD-GYP domain-containing protein (c-di-GMP phosphodiesterase class II)
VSAAHIHVLSPPEVTDFLRETKLEKALTGVAALADCRMTLNGEDAPPALPDAAAEFPICYRAEPRGRVISSAPGGSPVARASGVVAAMLEHALEREAAVSDLSAALMMSFEELNVLYTLLPALSARQRAGQIGKLLVMETARLLDCGRVSLLVLDEKRQALRVLAAHGLPRECRDVVIPVQTSIAGRVLLDEDVLLVHDISQYPDLLEQSRGSYASRAFAIARIPLKVRGEPLGVLTATDRRDGGEFTARDRKLLDALTAVGASALQNCRLHAAVQSQMLSTISALASAVDAKDHYTHDHSGRVSRLSVATLDELGVEDDPLRHELELAALLHDIGKIGIPDAILTKSGPLTPDEFEIIKTHVRVGADILGHVDGLQRAAHAVLHHHERFDGSGYLAGLAGDEIPLMSRIIAVADVFDCLTTDRPYRKASRVEEALAELRACKRTHFDPQVVDAFIAVIQRTESPALAPAPA